MRKVVLDTKMTFLSTANARTREKSLLPIEIPTEPETNGDVDLILSTRSTFFNSS